MSGKWIGARAVVTAMWPDKRPPPPPINSIIKGAEDGVVQAWAESLTKDGIGEKIKLPSGLIPAEFWGGRAMVPDWECGVFTAKVQKNGSEEEWRAYGVAFDRAAIEAMAPPPVPVGNPPPPASTNIAVRPAASKNLGGNPGKYDWAMAVGAVIFEWGDDGTWHPTKTGEVKAKLIDWFTNRGQSPDDKELKRYARWLLDEFKRRNSEAK